MAIRSLPAGVLICASLLSVPGASYACDVASHNSPEHTQAELSELIKAGDHASLYSFRQGACVHLDQVKNELEISQFLPSDEESLGLYQVYRDRGDSPSEALKHTLDFLVAEQQS